MAVTTPSSSTPAAWTTTVGRCAARSPASSVRSATSQAATVTVAPSAVSSSRSPGACPRRPTRTRRRTRCAVTRWWASSRPSVPVPPVISTVSSGPPNVPAPRGTARTSRRASTCPPRNATSGSSAARAAATVCGVISSASSRTNRPGSSVCADRTRPMTAAPARSGTSSPLLAATAPEVRNTSLESAKRGPAIHAWTSPSARCADSPTEPAEPATSTAPGAGRPAASAFSRACRSGKAANRSVSSPTTAMLSGATPPAGCTSTHLFRNSASRGASVPSVRTAAGRSASESTDSTGSPSPSVTVRRIPASKDPSSRTRSVDGAVARALTPVQANGSRGPSDAGAPPPNASACRAESSSAGWTTKPRGSTGQATSAKTVSSRRHTRRSPWNAAP